MRSLLLTVVTVCCCCSLSAQKVGLVLSGGGAKGLSHIGVIRALEEHDIPIDGVAGTSIGAIIGALYAIGYSPDEMVALLSSKDFHTWYRGLTEEQYMSYIYQPDPQPDLFFTKFDFVGGKLQLQLPGSLVSTEQMDLAFLHLFSPADAVAQGCFDSLMVPFRCVASDITNKRQRVLRRGNLGAAVRASMSYPFYFKPVAVDSLLLFDGGFYNNFPWDVAQRELSPEVIIGAKCGGNPGRPDLDNVVSQIENMIMFTTDYNLPDSLGVVVETVPEDVGMLDFSKIDYLVQAGYRQTLAQMDAIKARIAAREPAAVRAARRRQFRARLPEEVFKQISVTGTLSAPQRQFVEQTMRRASDAPFNYGALKRRYFRVISTDLVNTFFPTATYHAADSAFEVSVHATRKARFKAMVGGYFSSSSINELFFGGSYKLFGATVGEASVGATIGRFYNGFGAAWKHYIYIDPVVFYELQVAGNRYDYFSGAQDLFYFDRRLPNVQEEEVYGKLTIGIPVFTNTNTMAKVSFTGGRLHDYYFQYDYYNAADTADLMRFGYFHAQGGLERNTLDYKQYPTAGKEQSLRVSYTYGQERHFPGSLSELPPQAVGRAHTRVGFRFYSNTYFPVGKYFSAGLLVDAKLAPRTPFDDYYSTLLSLSAFAPTPHSTTLIMENYRADTYIGLGVMPVVRLNGKLSLRLGGYVFQPHETLLRSTDDRVTYSDPFSQRAYMGMGALVWHTPVGPLSLSANWYQRAQTKWYLHLGFGYLLFNKRGLGY